MIASEGRLRIGFIPLVAASASSPFSTSMISYSVEARRSRTICDDTVYPSFTMPRVSARWQSLIDR